MFPLCDCLMACNEPHSLFASLLSDRSCCLHACNIPVRPCLNSSKLLLHLRGSLVLLQISMPRDNLHFGNVEHRDLHNLHGLLFHKATALGLIERGAGLSSEGDRPFVLTRSFFAGSQRWGPMWTGDNEATWEALHVSIPMLLASGIAGYPWAGNSCSFSQPLTEQNAKKRWMMVVALLTFSQQHSRSDRRSSIKS